MHPAFDEVYNNLHFMWVSALLKQMGIAGGCITTPPSPLYSERCMRYSLRFVLDIGWYLLILDLFNIGCYNLCTTHSMRYIIIYISCIRWMYIIIYISCEFQLTICAKQMGIAGECITTPPPPPPYTLKGVCAIRWGLFWTLVDICSY